MESWQQPDEIELGMVCHDLPPMTTEQIALESLIDHLGDSLNEEKQDA